MADEIYYDAPAAVPSTRAATVEKEPILHKLMNLRVLRAFQRYGAARGPMLSGGIAYSALFSIAAALTIGITVFMAVLGQNEPLRETVFDGVNDALPGILQTAENPDGLVNPETLVLDTALTPTSIIAAGVLLWTALSMMNALKMSIRSMFGISRLPENAVVLKLRDLVAFAALAVGVLVGSVLTSAASTLGGSILSFIGIDGTVAAWLVRIASLAVAFLVDLAVIVLLFRFTAGARPPRRDLLMGAALGALGTSVVRLLGTSVIGSVSDNPVLGSFVAIATLLLWVNFVSRIILLAAAFTANPPAPAKVEVPESIHAHETPNYVTLSDPATSSWNYEPFTGIVVPDLTADPEFSDRQADDLPEWDTLEGIKRRARIRELRLKLEREKMNYRLDRERDLR